MRTEMVIRMQGGSEKGHAAKAMKVAAAIEGVESVTLAGKDKSLLRVVGDGVDCNYLTTRLRRKVGHADVVELRTLHGGSGAAYGHGGGYARTSSGYGGSYGGYATASSSSYAPAAASDYYSRQPSFQYYTPPAYAYAPPATQYEYYTTANDPNGCSIM